MLYHKLTIILQLWLVWWSCISDKSGSGHSTNWNREWFVTCVGLGQGTSLWLWPRFSPWTSSKCPSWATGQVSFLVWHCDLCSRCAESDIETWRETLSFFLSAKRREEEELVILTPLTLCYSIWVDGQYFYSKGWDGFVNSYLKLDLNGEMKWMWQYACVSLQVNRMGNPEFCDELYLC